MRISGNIDSIKDYLLEEMDSLFELDFNLEDFIPEELAIKLAEYSWALKREISVYINRKGKILDISIGDSNTVSLSEVEGRRDTSRLSGVRCIHTHPGASGRLSVVDINSLIGLRLDAMIAIGIQNGEIKDIYAGIPLIKNDKFSECEMYGPFGIKDKERNNLFSIVLERDKPDGSALYLLDEDEDEERAILVTIESQSPKIINGKTEGERYLEELEELANTAGATVVEKVIQRKKTRDPAFYIGKGKLEEISLIRQVLKANVIIFDDELSGAQIRNIEEVVGVKVLDRTSLILDIFAQRAISRDGKLQVELAQLKYRLPRLTGMGVQLSRLGGGIGTRGPGETKLEVDKRHIRKKINILENDIKKLIKRRDVLRESRSNLRAKTVALVGYTNVGKSTLMNNLCDANIFAENKLFATLDPTVRKLTLEENKELLLIDTVGFIRKLPHNLVKAFKSTLEEVIYGDILLHVVDSSSEEFEEQIEVVDSILEELGASDKETIILLNKSDLVKYEDKPTLLNTNKKVFEISAKTGYGLDKLKEFLNEVVPANEIEGVFLVPYSQGWIHSYICEHGRVDKTEYLEEGTKIWGQIKISKFDHIKEFKIE